MVEQPQGKVQAEDLVKEDGNKLDTGALKAKLVQLRYRKVVG